jgi:hypothetical protein
VCCVGLHDWGPLHHHVFPCIEVLLFLSQQRALVSGSISLLCLSLCLPTAPVEYNQVLEVEELYHLLWVTSYGLFQLTDTSEIMNLSGHLVGLIGWGITQKQGLYLHMTAQHRHGQTSMPQVGFEPMIPVFEQTRPMP